MRGGVPVLFPQFADRGPLPKHGFVRNVAWHCVSEYQAHDVATLMLSLDTQQIATDWPHRARLHLTIEASSTTCVLRLSIENYGSSSFAWTGGLHPYFAISDIRLIQLDGLAALPIEDRYDPSLLQETATGPVFSDRPFERLYGALLPVCLLDGDRRVTLRSSGFSEWMIWNPGREGARLLADLPDADWSKFICIEPVIARAPAILAPSEAFTGVLTVTRDA